MNHPTSHSLQEHLTTAQAAPLLGISSRTLRRHAAQGRIEAVRASSPSTGCAWFIPQTTVEALRRGKYPGLKEAAPHAEEAMPPGVARLLEQVELLQVQVAVLEERIAELEGKDASILSAPHDDSRSRSSRAWWLFKKNK